MATKQYFIFIILVYYVTSLLIHTSAINEGDIEARKRRILERFDLNAASEGSIDPGLLLNLTADPGFRPSQAAINMLKAMAAKQRAEKQHRKQTMSQKSSTTLKPSQAHQEVPTYSYTSTSIQPNIDEKTDPRSSRASSTFHINDRLLETTPRLINNGSRPYTQPSTTTMKPSVTRETTTTNKITLIPDHNFSLIMNTEAGSIVALPLTLMDNDTNTTRGVWDLFSIDDPRESPYKDIVKKLNGAQVFTTILTMFNHIMLAWIFYHFKPKTRSTTIH